MMRDLAFAVSASSAALRAAFFSWLISSTQAPSSLTTWSQLPQRAAESISALARSIAS